MINILIIFVFIQLYKK